MNIIQDNLKGMIGKTIIIKESVYRELLEPKIKMELVAPFVVIEASIVRFT